ncbi:MAG: hypothetical protein JXA42_09360 [Anaerolineales bacterium]|nr:hypothetical protein [Anaerolineales bacterium]
MTKRKQPSARQDAPDRDQKEYKAFYDPESLQDIIRRGEKVKEIVKELEDSQAVTQETLLMEFRV